MSVPSRSNLNLKVLIIEEMGKTEYPEKTFSEQGGEPTTNSTHMTPMTGFEPGPHWWEASSLTTAPPLLPITKLPLVNQAYWFSFLQFLNAASLQLNMILTTHVPNVESNQQPEASVLRLINCLMDTMLSVFSSAPLARSVSRSSLKQLMQVLITVLSDDRLAELQDGPQIIRAINILMVKVIEMSDQTYVLG